MRALGVDPGSRATGFGVVEAQGSRLRFLACGVLRPAEGPLGERLAEIYRGLERLIQVWEPRAVAVESVFSARNARSALVLGQARGAALTACGLAGLAVHEYAPAEVKSAVTGSGRAAKGQIQHMVRLLLSLERVPASDAADALAVAICHLQRAPLDAAIARSQRRAGLPGVATRREAAGPGVGR